MPFIPSWISTPKCTFCMDTLPLLIRDSVIVFGIPIGLAILSICILLIVAQTTHWSSDEEGHTNYAKLGYYSFLIGGSIFLVALALTAHFRILQPLRVFCKPCAPA
uniref:Uncharacterized protein n=1 Tax=viral metagenome TaxID=1070528 RepID=A0A6C0BPV3_9ZZZZ